MKKMGLAVLALGLIATAASAEVTSVNLHQIPGTYGTPSVDTVNGVSSVAIESLDDGRIPYQLGTEGYDNWPSVLGGAGSPSVCVGTSCTVGTWAYFRWTNTDLQWGDDIHGYIGSSMDHLHYQFLALGATAPRTVQHTIQIYDMFPPSASHGTAIGVVTMGMMYTSMHVTYTYTNTLNAAFAATVAFTPVVLNSDSMWVSFRETGSNTYWLTGGRPTIAPNYSHNGVLLGLLNYYSAGTYYQTDYFNPLPFLTTTNGDFVGANIALALGIPEPATISLLALSGLLVLRRRRTRA